MPLRLPFRLEPSLQGRAWSVPLVLPVCLALCLAIGLAIQSVRATELHRRAVATALRDYASFVAWQYTRRASDYLRLSVGSTVSAALANVDASPVRPGLATGVVRDGVIQLERNGTAASRDQMAAALTQAFANAQRSNMPIGLLPAAGGDQAEFVGYACRRGMTGAWTGCGAIMMSVRDLPPVFAHVAAFAPLLPPSLVGSLPKDSLVSVAVSTAAGAPIMRLGTPIGLPATDTLGPDLAGILVTTTLYPAAANRLVAGRIPSSSPTALGGTLLVTLVLCAVAVFQMRRTQEIIRLRSDFVASVSHELKTPLAQISLFADTLAAPVDRPLADRQEYAAIIGREARRLGHLVDGILHFAGVTRDPAGPSSPRERLFLGEEIRSALTLYAPIAAARAVRLELRMTDDVEVALDRDAFRQVMLNVLDNAFKFGPDGQTIVMTVGVASGRATIWIDDAGPGIPRPERKRVFEPYVRIDRPGSRAGSGIGLAVVRDVVRRHGGAVAMSDAPGGGARVEIHLPIAAAAIHLTAQLT